MRKTPFVVIWLIVGLVSWAGYQVARPASAHKAPASTIKARRQSTQRQRNESLTLSSIFAAKAPSLAKYDHRNLRTLIATGDVIPGRSVNYKMVTYHDFLYPFRRTAGVLRRADVTLINLESPLINGCPVTDAGMSFCGDPRAVEGLRYAGVDVACTANNHIGNYYTAGIDETWAHLRAAGIDHCGLGSVARHNIHGVRFAFLAYNCVGQRFDYRTARREIRAAHRTGAVVVVSVHWGKEYVALPQIAPGVADDDPVRVAHWIIDSGADLIIGNHPHHVQGVEIYHGHLITYAHGNFVFDQMFSTATREGVVGTYTFYGHRLVSVRYRPVFIYDYSQPRWASRSQSRAIMAGMRQASFQLAQQHKG